jgi:hypothetical protein
LCNVITLNPVPASVCLVCLITVFKDRAEATVKTSGLGNVVVCTAETQEYFSLLTVLISKMAAFLLGKLRQNYALKIK